VNIAPGLATMNHGPTRSNQSIQIRLREWSVDDDARPEHDATQRLEELRQQLPGTPSSEIGTRLAANDQSPWQPMQAIHPRVNRAAHGHVLEGRQTRARVEKEKCVGLRKVRDQ
jgi:hypothetical protein